MTWHFFTIEDFSCPSCSAEFVPFETPQQCPRCGSLSYAETSFLSDVVAGLRIHKRDYGTYTSGAYFVGSKAESIFHWCCQALDAASQEQEGQPTVESVTRCLETIDWGDLGYMKSYFIALLGLVIPHLSMPSMESENS
jgi:hypothetical protein